MPYDAALEAGEAVEVLDSLCELEQANVAEAVGVGYPIDGESAPGILGRRSHASSSSLSFGPMHAAHSARRLPSPAA